SVSMSSVASVLPLSTTTMSFAQKSLDIVRAIFCSSLCVRITGVICSSILQVRRSSRVFKQCSGPRRLREFQLTSRQLFFPQILLPALQLARLIVWPAPGLGDSQLS